ncbi:hypothetical protein C8R43DRAFT_1120791 [Mycena crocata]|nr:hypothetical protein C8R43DRAFT_1120791 [Mycena crocata]
MPQPKKIASKRANTRSPNARSFRIDAIQFGLLYHDGGPTSIRSFSIEWEKRVVKAKPPPLEYPDNVAWLRFAPADRNIHIEIGDETTQLKGSRIKIPIESIKKIGFGQTFELYACFELHAPPKFESFEFYHRERKPNHIGSLDPAHLRIAPYAHHLRLVLHDEGKTIEEFEEQCLAAGVLKKSLLLLTSPSVIPSSHCKFLEEKSLYKMSKLSAQLEWAVAFQVERLLHNALVHPRAMVDDLMPKINDLCVTKDSVLVALFLKTFHDFILEFPHENPVDLWAKSLDDFRPAPSRESSKCQSVTVTPTRLVLDSALHTVQWNSVVNWYKNAEHNFLHVRFRDEDEMGYLPDTRADVSRRFLNILRTGVQIGGRNFEFVASITSPSHRHDFWFMTQFKNKNGEIVTPESILAMENLRALSATDRSHSTDMVVEEAEFDQSLDFRLEVAIAKFQSLP